MSGPLNVDALLESAIAHHTAMDWEQAETVYRDVLHAEPSNLDALNLLGVVLLDLGRADEGMGLLSKAIALDPDFPDAHANLARGLNGLGKTEDALAAAERACALDPGLGDGWLQRGLALLTLGRAREALGALREALVAFPDAVELHAAMGRAAQQAGDHPAAATSWRAVLGMQPNRREALINLGAALGNLKQLDEAVVLHRRAVDQAPEDRAAKYALAVTLHRRMEAMELLPLCRDLLSGDPAHIGTLILMGSALVWLGEFAEARECFQTVLTAQPDNAEARRQLLSLNTGPGAETDIATLREKLGDPAMPPQERTATLFVIARALDQRGDVDAAFPMYSEANARRHAALKDAHDQFNAAALHDQVNWACATFTPDVFGKPERMGDPSELPVLICGMPRSGTSLVEQIAASHPQVHGAGERKDLIPLVSRVMRGIDRMPPGMWDPSLLRAEASQHIAHLRTMAGTAERVTDKLPNNILYLGHIALLFPKARFVVCRRELRDICVSCFTTQFNDSVNWAYDQEECATRALEIERLADHWHAVLPGRILEIDYEALVGDLEAQSRRMIAFLGLAWDPACLEFHKTQRLVTTASYQQVRQPLYDSSVGRWRRYAAHLGPMLKILDDRKKS